MTGDSYLNEYLQVSAHLRTVLEITSRGGAAKRFQVGDALAEQLGIDTDPLDVTGYGVLTAMLEELEKVLVEGPGSWTGDIETNRHGRIARAAVEWLDLDEDLLAALRELRLTRFKPPLSISGVDDLEPQLRAVISDWLAPRIYKMLDQWRKRDVWNPDVKLGIVPRPGRRRD